MSELRSELWEKEMKLTDIRLEALNSAHQLEQLRETMHNMQVIKRTSFIKTGQEESVKSYITSFLYRENKLLCT